MLKAVSSLDNPVELEKQTRRLLADSRSRLFLDSFLGQWLDLRELDEIMPDPRLLSFNNGHLQAIRAEAHLFVAEILRENLPLETFIDPDFTYMNRRLAPLYGRKISRKDDKMIRVEVERGGRHGGILGMSAVMMATANGVDTQPVLRGVWLLENIFGSPTPEPPDDIPAVEPDTTGSKTIRELLRRHTADESCAGCHRRIDPLGFVLENFDPIGRWRDHYPVYQGEGEDVETVPGLPVDSDGVLPDGTALRDVVDLKRYLVEHIDLFGNCLATKLMTYGTGREPSFGDRQEISRLVEEVRAEGNGFRDLIVAVVLSESFRTK